ncbi:cytochrome d ubiquinol oxidase subunit II [Sphingomonas sp. TDK1]|nr:cytochrome d ubiquinol oxidase subunit II [Sphingomonas sp. TDK1]
MDSFWIGALALTIFLYVILDGFDLGVGMLLPFARGGRGRSEMFASIAPVWDGNETWLVLNGTILFGMFPLVYATLLSAFYLPLMLMLAALILRGVSFEYREKAVHTRALWEACFIGGSFVATLIQGTAVGALVVGLPMEGTRYVGGAFGWFSPFALLCGVGLCLGYMLIGAGWLTYKTGDAVAGFAFRLIPWLLTGVLVFLAIAFVVALHLDLSVMRLWSTRPLLFCFPALGLLAAIGMIWAVRHRRPLMPFLFGVTLFAAAFATLGFSFYPYMIPFAITASQAVAPPSSVAFLFYGAGLFVLPLTLVYTLVVYFVFKGRVGAGSGYGAER